MKVERLNGTAMNISWIRLSIVEAQSVALSYVVKYFPQSIQNRQIRQVTLPDNQSYVVLHGLNPETIYQVEMLAINDYGQSISVTATNVGEFYTYIQLYLELYILLHSIIKQ